MLAIICKFNVGSYCGSSVAVLEYIIIIMTFRVIRFIVIVDIRVVGVILKNKKPVNFWMIIVYFKRSYKIKLQILKCFKSVTSNSERSQYP